MLTVVLIRPGSTDFDEQGRIKGTLDVSLNENGAQQVARTVEELSDLAIAAIYSSPCRCCQQTAAALAGQRGLKVNCLKCLHNLDRGLWQGMLIEEVKQKQPRVYRQWQEHPETVCPPKGESLVDARQRVAASVARLCKKHRDGVIAVVAPEPLASLMGGHLRQSELGDLWKAECDCGRWEEIHVEPRDLVLS